MNIAEFPLHFLRPWWWLALLPLPFALWALARAAAGTGAFVRLVDAPLLPYLVQGGRRRRGLAMAGVAVAWLLGTAALAGPAWQRVQTPLYVNGAARVVSLSLSTDMLARDLQPDRLTRARLAVRDLLAGAGDARTALVAYAGAAFTVAPLTGDQHTVLNLLRALRPDVMPVPGNDAAAGIEQATRLLQDAHVAGGQVIVVTDRADAAAVAAARKAHASGITVDVLGVGTSRGAPVPAAGGGFANGPDGTLLARRDDASLRAVARAGGGHYEVLPVDGSATPEFAAPIATAGHASHDARALLWRDGGIWLLPVLVVLAALAFRRGWLCVLALLLLPATMPAAHAASWTSWFSNRDQRALQALARGDAARARSLATTPGLRGAAAYRQGDYAAAASDFGQTDSANADYNRGNALAQAGRYEDAIKAYDQALERDPHMADARANRKAVRDWLARNRQAPKSGQSGTSPPSSSGQHGRRGQGSSSPPPSSAAPPSSASRARPSPGSTAGQATRGAPRSAEKPAPASSSASGRDATPPASAPAGDEAERAARGLRHALEHARPGKDQGAFALGQEPAREQGPFNAHERALLHAVPDDPGALLRRKFRLEWEQRQRAGQEDGP